MSRASWCAGCPQRCAKALPWESVDESARAPRAARRRAGGIGVAHITAGNRLKSIRTARSAFSAFGRYLTSSSHDSGKNGLEWRDSRPRGLLAAGDSGRPGSPTSREAVSSGRISGRTCWSAGLGATASRMAVPPIRDAGNRGLAHALMVRKPADPMFNIGAAEGCSAPLRSPPETRGPPAPLRDLRLQPRPGGHVSRPRVVSGHESPADEERGRAIQTWEAGIASADWNFADRSKNSRHLRAAGFPRPFLVSTPQ